MTQIPPPGQPPQPPAPPVPYQPLPQQSPGDGTRTAVAGLGIAAIVVGAIAVLGALIPFCGLIISMPLAGIGILLGVVGLVLALANSQKPMLPIVGVCICVLALIVGAVVTKLAGHAMEGIAKQAEQQVDKINQQMQKELEKAHKEMAAAATRAAATDLSLEKYDQLMEGASYSEVVQALGTQGISSPQTDGTTNYTWFGTDGSIIVVSFKDGKLIAKQQSNLKKAGGSN